MCLDRVTHQMHMQRSKPFEAPKNTARLFDLVRALEPKFEEAFYFALKDTIVCKDLNTAHSVAFG